MTKKEYVLSHSSELNILAAMPLFRARGLGVLRLGGVMGELPKRAEWERELNRSYYACGCEVGAKGLLVGLATGGIGATYGVLRGGWNLLPAIGVVLGAAAAGAVVGKLIGVLRARRRLKTTIREIETATRPREPKITELIPCG